jgi:Ca-activated chloride channel family protein
MDLGELRLLHPQFLLLLLLFPAGLWLALRRVRRGTLLFSSLAPFRSVPGSLRLRLRFVPGLLRLLGLGLLVLALARPQKGLERAIEKARGIGILIAIDNSGSMLCDDFELDGRDVTRIDAVKRVAHDFIKGAGGLPGRPNDEIGLISFSGYPVPRAPVTLDHGAVLEVLRTVKVLDPSEIETDERGRPLDPAELGTAIGDALALSASRLRDLQVKSKAIILLTDGRQTYGELDPLEGAQIAESFGVKVYCIGVGRPGRTLCTVDHPLVGRRKEPRRSDLDEETMQQIAERTGGRYYNAASTDALRQVYAEIDRLERTEIESTGYSRWDERFTPLALAGLIALALEAMLAQTVFRRIP